MSIERWLGAIAGLAVGLAVLYYLYGPQIQDWLPHKEPELTQVPVAPKPAAPEAQGPQYPVPEAPVQAEAPAPEAPAAPTPPPPADLADSDADVRRALSQVFGNSAVDALLVRERVVQKIVVTVDSLDRAAVPMRMRAVGEIPGLPVVDKQGETLALSPDNGERYRLPVDALAHADAKAITAMYFHEYPLFQRAYRELGYPKGYFNDRLVAVIDHLLATPEPDGPILLTRPKVLYEFADPDLEALSSGQKAMLRIGAGNRAVVKDKLREIRALLVARGRPRQS